MLHLSKRKRAPILGARKKLTQKRPPDPDSFYQELENLRIKYIVGSGSFYAEGFFLLHNGGAFLSSLGVAHRRCAHRISASRLGELVLIED